MPLRLWVRDVGETGWAIALRLRKGRDGLLPFRLLGWRLGSFMLVKLPAAERGKIYAYYPFIPGSILGADDNAGNPPAIDHLIKHRNGCRKIVRCWELAAGPQLLDGIQNRYPGRIRTGFHKWKKTSRGPRITLNSSSQTRRLSYIRDYDSDLIASPV